MSSVFLLRHNKKCICNLLNNSSPQPQTQPQPQSPTSSELDFNARRDSAAFSRPVRFQILLDTAAEHYDHPTSRHFCSALRECLKLSCGSVSPTSARVCVCAGPK
ncbi:uncharacterized protein DMAD_11577 [Drosophila madeirensis]|uniref:Uncharacterized protein n=1 Tax=Drosophila madeirensis TaxID=30013 RepID=A0AAU9FDK7_DROMD